MTSGAAAPPEGVPAATTFPPLRVLRLIARLNVGGPARHVIILNAGLQQLGFTTRLAFGSTAADEASLEDLANDRGIAMTHIPELGRRISAAQDLRAFAAVYRLIAEWKPDIIHTHTAKAGALGRSAALAYNAKAARHRRCAVLHTFHGHVFSGYFGRVGNFAVRNAERTLAGWTDQLVSISPRQRNDLVSTYRIAHRAKVAVVPLGLELDPFVARPLAWRGARAALGFSSGDFVVGFVGRLVPIKDVPTLLHAIAIARQRNPHVRGVVAGDGQLRADLERLAGTLHLTGVVQFLGWRSDLVDLYAAMDVFVLTSKNEGTPVAMIEAMAAGVPVIATSVGGVPDVLERGGGRLVGAGDAAGIADAICEAAAGRAAGATLVPDVREHIGARFGAGRLVTETAALYAETVARVRSKRR